MNQDGPEIFDQEDSCPGDLVAEIYNKLRERPLKTTLPAESSSVLFKTDLFLVSLILLRLRFSLLATDLNNSSTELTVTKRIWLPDLLSTEISIFYFNFAKISD